MNILRSLSYRTQRLIYGPEEGNYVPEAHDYVYLDPLDMPQLDRDALLNGKKTGVWYETDGKQRHFMRGAPAFVDDPDNTGLFSAEDTAATRMTYPPALAIGGRNVHLTGYRSFLTGDRRFFTDDALLSDRRASWLWHFKHPAIQLNEDTGFKVAGYADTFTLSKDFTQAEHIPGRTVVLVSQEPFNYGSWLFRVLTKVASLERLGLMDETILVHTPYPSFRDSLALAGINPDRLIQHDTGKLYRLDHAIVPGQRNGHALLDMESRAVFARLREKVAYDYDGRKLYVARHTPGKEAVWNGRVLLNEGELIERLKPLGFQIVLPGTLNMEEQIRTFASAGLVVGGSGSALFNAVFCRPGTKLIDIESEPNWINAHCCLFSSAGLDYGIFVGIADPTDTADVHKRWRVNIEALVDRIRQFDGR